MADFRIAYNIVRQHEGGYANNKADNGGETFKGIARKFWSDWSGWKFIDAIKSKFNTSDADVIDREAAKIPDLQNAVLAFYKSNFWNVLSLDAVINQDIANELFDTAVNMSTNTAGEFLQRSLNVLNRNGQDYSDLLVDGKIGQKTITVLNAHKYPQTVLKVLNCLQGAKYISICEHNPSQEIFIRSWMSRVAI